MKLFVIMQGVPGSGKTTIANHLTRYAGALCSTDSYFVDKDGIYRFDKSKLNSNHRKCQLDVEWSMKEGTSLIVLDNTNIKQAHVDPYLELAKRYGYTPIVIRANGRYPNVHHVPEQFVERMRLEMEDLIV